MDFVLLVLCLFAVLFNFAGYVWILVWLKKFRPLPVPNQVMTGPYPKIFFLIPCLNEAKGILRKLSNTHDQNYPNLEIIVVDGGSKDDTVNIARSYATLNGITNVKVLNCATPGKIAQLNMALEQIPKEAIVVVSDADAILQKNDALQIAARLLANPNVGLVGGWGLPDESAAIGIESAYWDKQNRMRYLEAEAYSSSIVTALFYAFPRDLISTFPADCVADDVYISYCAHLKEKRVLYSAEIDAVEIRQAKTYKTLFYQKLRRANAYSIELFRPLHRLPFMRKRMKFLYGFKVFQFFHLPWISVLFLYLWLNTFFTDPTLFFGLSIFVFIVLLITSFLIVPPPSKIRGGINLTSAVHTLASFALVNLVLILNSFIFPFWRQNAVYAKPDEPPTP